MREAMPEWEEPVSTVTDGVAKDEAVAIKRAFGAENRNRLIDVYFSEHADGSIIAANAWEHVYRLLLWVDQTTGLGHCYESDKCQPGRPWYGRSLAFHDWVSSALKVSPEQLALHLDWLFLHASENLAAYVLRETSKLSAKVEAQRAPYKGKGLPKPGEDPELVSIVQSIIGPHLGSEPPKEIWNQLVQRIRQHLNLENKRKNLVGEGFEDVLTHIIRRTCKRAGLEVHARKALHDLPGFNRARVGEKPNKVDVAVIHPTFRTLVTAKWSVRADREKQFVTDFTDYISAESDRKPFDYVFVTNEFDPARLARACEQLGGNAPMFKFVVHISTDALKATYGASAGLPSEPSMRRVLKFIEDGRLISLRHWLEKLDGSLGA